MFSCIFGAIFFNVNIILVSVLLTFCFKHVQLVVYLIFYINRHFVSPRRLGREYVELTLDFNVIPIFNSTSDDTVTNGASGGHFK